MDELIRALNLIHDNLWNEAHEIVQSRSDAGACWIHAHLHRIEGDDGNASYWYRQAGRPIPQSTIAEEWQQIHDSLVDS